MKETVSSESSALETEAILCKMCGSPDNIVGRNGSGWPICSDCKKFHNITVQPYPDSSLVKEIVQ